MVCCFVLAQKLFSKSLAIPHISELEDRLFQLLHTWNQSSRFILSPLRCSCRRALARSHPLDSISPALLSPHSRAPERCFAASSSDALKLAFQRGQLHFLSGESAATCATQILRRLAATPVSQKLGWSIPSHPSRPRVCAPVSRRYTHRVAISNHRLVSLANRQVTFRWRDSAHTMSRS